MSRKPEYPKVVTLGNARVTIYRRTTPKGNPAFMVGYKDTDGKRRFLCASTNPIENNSGDRSTFDTPFCPVSSGNNRPAELHPVWRLQAPATEEFPYAL